MDVRIYHLISIIYKNVYDECMHLEVESKNRPAYKTSCQLHPLKFINERVHLSTYSFQKVHREIKML